MFKNIIDLIEKLKTEAQCINLFIQLRWNNKVICPYKDCKKEGKVYHFKDGKRFQCSCCDRIFSYKTGTIFENSKIPMKKWFIAIYLHTAHKKGISSCQLAKDISVTQKTAWFMLGRIREISKNFDNNNFDGTIEADECYIGGDAKNKHMKKRIELKGKDDKAVVFGMINRETKQVKAVKVNNASANELNKHIYNTLKEGSVLITDEHKSYKSISHFKYNHKTVNHSRNEYVRDEQFETRENGRKAFKVHTNTMEGYWGLLKRGIDGIYHWVSKKHIDRYLKEFNFRYNTKAMKDSVRFEYFLSKTIGRLKYNTLISKEEISQTFYNKMITYKQVQVL